MKPTLYDILGVPEDAGRDQIKAAWRDAADRFEPGSGGSSAQFRLFNEAAEVLLDPARRSAYDDELARDRSRASGTTEPDRGPGERPAGAVAVVPTAATAGPEAEPRDEARDADTDADTDADAARADDRPRRRLPGWVLVALAVVTALAVLGAVVAGVAAQRLGFLGFPSALQAQTIEDAQQQAPAAAERAAVAVLGYDYQSLEADRDNAAKFLTEDYRQEYVETFDSLVTENAKATEAKVEAEVRASSVMLDPGDDTGRVRVLMFVNQTTRSTANRGQPQRALNRVVFTMEKVDGSWLVDEIASY